MNAIVEIAGTKETNKRNVLIFTINYSSHNQKRTCIYTYLQVHDIVYFRFIGLLDGLTYYNTGYTMYACMVHSLLYTGCTNIGYWPYV